MFLVDIDALYDTDPIGKSGRLLNGYSTQSLHRNMRGRRCIFDDDVSFAHCFDQKNIISLQPIYDVPPGAAGLMGSSTQIMPQDQQTALSRPYETYGGRPYHPNMPYSVRDAPGLNLPPYEERTRSLVRGTYIKGT